jgi:hypothetical protein
VATPQVECLVRVVAYFRRKKSSEKPPAQQGPGDAKEERGSQILWRIWLERRQGRKRTRGKSEPSDEPPTQAVGTSLEHGLSLNQAKGARTDDNGTSQTSNGSESEGKRQSQSEICVRRKSMHSSAEDSLPSDDDDVFERLSVPKLARYPSQVLISTCLLLMVLLRLTPSNKHTDCRMRLSPPSLQRLHVQYNNNQRLLLLD